MPIAHIILEDGEALVHIYATSLNQRIEEARRRGQPLTGVYSYRRDQPIGANGQYHLHIFEKNNEIFAINWNGSAHDQSHHKVIPLRVYDALRAKFPTLSLPDRNTRVIESINPLSLDKLEDLPPCRGVTPAELIALKEIIEGEDAAMPTIRCEPFSKVKFLYGRYFLHCGQPLLLAAAEHDDGGAVAGEAHLFWLPPGLGAISRQLFNRRRPQDAVPNLAACFTVQETLDMARNWAVGEVQRMVQQQWHQLGKTEIPPIADFSEGTVYNLLALWAFGRARPQMDAIAHTVELESLKAFLVRIIRVPPFEPIN